MYLRETRPTNRDGSVMSYLQLAHNERHPQTGSPVAKVIHNFGRAEQVDRAALARLVSSISRFLTPEQATAAAAGGGGDRGFPSAGWGVDAGPGLERLWIGAAIRRVAAGRRARWGCGRGGRVRPGRAAGAQAGQQARADGLGRQAFAIGGLTSFTGDQAYRAMDFLLDALVEIASEIFGSVAHLLNLDLGHRVRRFSR